MARPVPSFRIQSICTRTHTHLTSAPSLQNLTMNLVTTPASKALTSDQKFNVVLFGVNENSNGTPRASSTTKDMEVCTEISQHTNDDINFHSIRDCFHLGKYNPTRPRPRPILVKLAWAFNADTVLYNRSKAPNRIWIKPDMNPEQRKTEAALLSERWRLISSGVD